MSEVKSDELTEEVKEQAIGSVLPWRRPGRITGNRPTAPGRDERFHQTLGESPTGSADSTGFRQVLTVVDGDEIIVADLYGEILVEHTRLLRE